MEIESTEKDGFSYTIDEIKKVCCVKGSGKITFRSSVDAMADLVNDPKYKKDFCIIVDIRSINYQPTYDELIGIKNRLIFLKKSFENKIALVTTGRITILGELVSIFSRLAGINMSSFSDIDKAIKWIES